MKIINAWLAAGILLAAQAAQAQAPSVVVQTALNATPPSACETQEKAAADAGDLALKAAQTYCRSAGFGWRAASLKESGKLDCQRCGSGQVSCAYSAVSLECRKAAPKLNWW